MDSGLIGKVEKSKRYAEEPERIRFSDFTLRFQGDHRQHLLTFHEGCWHCTCSFFPRSNPCSHFMAAERILGHVATLVSPPVTPPPS